MHSNMRGILQRRRDRGVAEFEIPAPTARHDLDPQVRVKTVKGRRHLSGGGGLGILTRVRATVPGMETLEPVGRLAPAYFIVAFRNFSNSAHDLRAASGLYSSAAMPWVPASGFVKLCLAPG